jgi:hypothetical protein
LQEGKERRDVVLGGVEVVVVVAFPKGVMAVEVA